MKVKFFNKISVIWQLFIYLSLFAAATLLLLWLFQVVFLESFYKMIKINDIKSTAANVINNINNEDLQSYITDISNKRDVNILILDEDAQVTYSSDVNANSFITRVSPQALYDLLESVKTNDNLEVIRFVGDEFENQKKQFEEFPGSIRPLYKGAMESMYYIKSVTNNDGAQLFILLSANISPVDATVMTIRTQLIYVTAIMLAIALLLALFISKRISKPIVKMNASAKEFAIGKYDVSFDESGYKEISELAQTMNYAADELSKTDNLRKELIANISHDLRTPLTMIIGYAEVMRDLPKENTPENVQIIIDESKRLTDLVNDILDISKLQSGTQSINITPFNLTQSINDILKRYSKLIEQDGYTIKFINDGDVIVKADEIKISQVIYNLVNNAITYTGRDKTVMVRQKKEDNKVKIEVIDTGEGIAPDKLKDIWDRYYKVDKEHKRAQIGTGLGLSIVKAILEQHHTRYGVQTTKNQGSIFWFELDIE